MNRNRLCKCGRITSGPLCESCNPPRPKPQKGTTKERGYGNDWRRLSERMRDDEPLCIVHEARGMVRPARERHHITKITDAPELRLVRSNTVSVCRACHVEIEGMSDVQLEHYLQELRATNEGG